MSGNTEATKSPLNAVKWILAIAVAGAAFF